MGKALLMIVIVGFSTPNVAWCQDLKCMDLSGGLEVISKVTPNKYEVDIWGWMTPRYRRVLITNKTEFTATGVLPLGRHLWVELPKTEEKIEITTKEGFKQSISVLRESAACEKQEGAKATAKEKAYWDEEMARRRKAQEQSDADELARKKSIEHEQKMTPEEKEAEDKADREEAERVAQDQAEQERKEEEVVRKQGEELDKKFKTWFAIDEDRRIEICKKIVAPHNIRRRPKVS